MDEKHTELYNALIDELNNKSDEEFFKELEEAGIRFVDVEKITFKKFCGHLKTVLKHKWWVFYYCCQFGIPWRGIKHDMSKFSPTEFWESVRYYQGNRSPIDACKEQNGYSKAS